MSTFDDTVVSKDRKKEVILSLMYRLEADQITSTELYPYFTPDISKQTVRTYLNEITEEHDLSKYQENPLCVAAPTSECIDSLSLRERAALNILLYSKKYDIIMKYDGLAYNQIQNTTTLLNTNIEKVYAKIIATFGIVFAIMFFISLGVTGQSQPTRASFVLFTTMFAYLKMIEFSSKAIVDTDQYFS